MKYVLATANPGKINEMRNILAEFNIDIITRDELGINMNVEETGTTLLENATIKAKAICKLSNMPSIADDSGLMVDALGGEPGVYSSSYGGEGLNTIEHCAYLLDVMEGRKERTATFTCTIVCAFPDGKILMATGECHGEIVIKPRGSGGFGYDSVFLPRGMKKTMAELSPDEKNAISHRKLALVKFSELLKSYNTEGAIPAGEVNNKII
jgi:XTP/dITP diphosphohydrolase